MAKWKHRLRKLNIDARTAVCDVCGPTHITIRHKNNWRCGKGKNAARRGGGEEICRTPKPTVCEICQLEKPLCWDHDHRTGKHRGWLCRNCNLALGNFYDDIENLERARTYLIQSRL